MPSFTTCGTETMSKNICRERPFSTPASLRKHTTLVTYIVLLCVPGDWMQWTTTFWHHTWWRVPQSSGLLRSSMVLCEKEASEPIDNDEDSAILSCWEPFQQRDPTSRYHVSWQLPWAVRPAVKGIERKIGVKTRKTWVSHIDNAQEKFLTCWDSNSYYITESQDRQAWIRWVAINNNDQRILSPLLESIARLLVVWTTLLASLLVLHSLMNNSSPNLPP